MLASVGARLLRAPVVAWKPAMVNGLEGLFIDLGVLLAGRIAAHMHRVQAGTCFAPSPPATSRPPDGAVYWRNTT